MWRECNFEGTRRLWRWDKFTRRSPKELNASLVIAHAFVRQQKIYRAVEGDSGCCIGWDATTNTWCTICRKFRWRSRSKYCERNCSYVSQCGVEQETYEGTVVNYFCSTLLVFTLWNMTNIYPCSRTVWESYCTDGSPFENIFFVNPTNVYSQVDNIVNENITHLFYEQVNMFNTSLALM